MTVLALALGSDRVLAVQDSGIFERAAPYRHVATTCKFALLPERRMMSASCGSTAVSAEWRKAFTLGVVGDTLADVSAYGPALLRSWWQESAGPSVVIVAALGHDGLAGALAMSSGSGFRTLCIPRGHVVLIPNPADPPPKRPAESDDKPKAEPPPESAEPDNTPPPDVDADWTWLRRRLVSGIRQQIEQRRVPFAPPFTSALLHRDGIDLREFRP